MERRTALHIMGYSIGFATLSGWLQSCQDEPEGSSISTWHSPAEIQILAELGEVILPRTTSVGAKDVEAHLFVDRFAGEVLDEATQTDWRSGLDAWLATYKQRQSTTDTAPDKLLAELERYWSIPKEEQEEIREWLRQDEPTEPEAQNRWRAYRWLFDFKKLLLLGYYQSEQVGREVLAYDPIPGGYEACIPIEAGTPAWSL